MDASAGRHDEFAVCVSHVVGDGDSKAFVADVVRGRAAPFNPNEVAKEYADLAHAYRITEVTGDNFAGEWVTAAFRDAGIGYKKSDLPKSALYLEGVSTFNIGRVSLPDDAKLIRELRTLERQVHRSGKDSVDHPRGGSDDRANAVFGAMWILGVAGSKRRGEVSVGSISPLTGAVSWPGRGGRVSAFAAENNGAVPTHGPKSRTTTFLRNY